LLIGAAETFRTALKFLLAHFCSRCAKIGENRIQKHFCPSSSLRSDWRSALLARAFALLAFGPTSFTEE
jgi:hypothetical protein